MRVTLPEKVTGVRDALFVLEVEFPVASVERTVSVGVTGPIEPLDLSGSGRGGSYRIPVGLERLHVPMRVLEDGMDAAKIVVTCEDGPEAGERREHLLKLEAPARAPAAAGWRKWLVGALALVVLGVGAWQLLGRSADRVPDVAGRDASAARALLAEGGFVVRVRHAPASDAEAAGRVLRQEPAGGATATADRIVELVVASAPTRPRRLPSVVGAPEKDAKVTLEGLGYPVVVAYEPHAEAGRAGTVLRQDPAAGADDGAGGAVTIVVAEAPDAVRIPSLLDETREEAAAALDALGLGARFRQEPTDEARHHGRVLRQEPAPGESLPPGRTVDVVVGRFQETAPPAPSERPVPEEPSTPNEVPVEVPSPAEGPAPTPREPPSTVPTRPDDGSLEMPDLVGMERKEAEARLEAAGLTPLTTLVLWPQEPSMAGKVVSQQPAAGGRAQRGGMVLLTIARRKTPLATAPPEEAAPEAPPPEEPAPTPPRALRPMPDVVGMPRGEAHALLEDEGYDIEIETRATDVPPPGTVLAQDPAPGGRVARGGTVRLEVAVAPPPPVAPPASPGQVVLPPRDAPRTQVVPDIEGTDARAAIEQVLRAGLVPIIEVVRTSEEKTGTVLGVRPPAGGRLLPGDLVRLQVSVPTRVGERTVWLPMAVGANLDRARRMFAGTRTGYDVVEVHVPGHPYAGTGRVAAQYPVSAVPSGDAGRATLWVVLP